MYILMSSMDCGYSYHPYCQAETIEDLQPQIDEVNKSHQRWYLEQDGKPVDDVMCPIHKDIFDFLKEV